jgi:hypothetical protein
MSETRKLAATLVADVYVESARPGYGLWRASVAEAELGLGHYDVAIAQQPARRRGRGSYARAT